MGLYSLIETHNSPHKFGSFSCKSGFTSSLSNGFHTQTIGKSRRVIECLQNTLYRITETHHQSWSKQPPWAEYSHNFLVNNSPISALLWGPASSVPEMRRRNRDGSPVNSTSCSVLSSHLEGDVENCAMDPTFQSPFCQPTLLLLPPVFHRSVCLAIHQEHSSVS